MSPSGFHETINGDTRAVPLTCSRNLSNKDDGKYQALDT